VNDVNREEKRPTVLLAEDAPDVRAVLHAALDVQGYDVIEIADGTELLQHLEMCRFESYARPDVIVSDVLMPGHSGLAALSSLRYEGVGIPFILITAHADAVTRAEAKARGASALLFKPFDLCDFLKTVDAAKAHV